jgi:hypothetical protein
MKTHRLDARELRQRAGLFTQTETAGILNVDIWSFFGRVRSGAWPKPGTAIGRGKRLYYGLDQIEELRRLIGGERD